MFLSHECLSPSLSPLTGALGGDLESVGVHGGHDVDARVVEQPADVVVGLVVLDEVEDEVEHELPAHDLVAVHIGHVLDVGLADHVLVGRAGDDHHPHLATCRDKEREKLTFGIEFKRLTLSS